MTDDLDVLLHDDAEQWARSLPEPANFDDALDHAVTLSVPPRRRHWVLPAIAAAVVVGLAIAITIFTAGHRGRAIPPTVTTSGSVKQWTTRGVTLTTPATFQENALGCDETPIADTVLIGNVHRKFCVYRHPPAVTSVFVGQIDPGGDEMSHVSTSHRRIHGRMTYQTTGIASTDPGEARMYSVEINFAGRNPTVLIKSPNKRLALRIAHSVHLL